VITNASTGSNAERFTVRLKKFKNTRTYGDRTRGALAYEIKPDDYHQLPSSGFTVILPSKVDRTFLDYETNGVVPDIYLDYKKNWIDAITSRIEDQN
jgi:C-terminal processing protease CtpA/Prc